jgi:cytidine deaminase
MKINPVDLVKAAREAAQGAYAPYSKFKVGAALLGKSGKVHVGFNVENISYGLSMCAERTAIYNARIHGEKGFLAVAVWTDSDKPVTPCGACRQVLNEFCGNVPVFVSWRSGRIRKTTLKKLLPEAFFEFPGAGRRGPK